VKLASSKKAGERKKIPLQTAAATFVGPAGIQDDLALNIFDILAGFLSPCNTKTITSAHALVKLASYALDVRRNKTGMQVLAPRTVLDTNART
jgi:hypothetical protein